MKILLMVFMCFVLSACAHKELLVKTQFKEVKIPIKCPLKIPLKPLDKGDFESAKQISKYYLEVEDIAKRCVE